MDFYGVRLFFSDHLRGKKIKFLLQAITYFIVKIKTNRNKYNTLDQLCNAWKTLAQKSRNRM